jgi:hypothetical protein
MPEFIIYSAVIRLIYAEATHPNLLHKNLQIAFSGWFLSNFFQPYSQ